MISLIVDKCFISNKPSLLYIISHSPAAVFTKKKKISQTLKNPTGYADQNKLL